MNDNKAIGLKIFNARKELKMSRAELGKLVNLHESTVKRYEDGEIKSVDIDKLKEFAKALNISPVDLLGWTERNSDLPNSESIKIQSNNSLPPLTTKDERSIQKRLESVLNDLMPGNSAIAYYDGEEPMSEEDKELLRISLENTMRLAKQMAKQKFTPKKYRK
ncbi:helix-turn-helix domain-containing protein [Sporomusa sphaeroides]|uniref:helix-turn-helix domain-containing protein n=1 Tax=Sporomusa sphaeroides TaxID=47679 RepID=UPI003D9FC167